MSCAPLIDFPEVDQAAKLRELAVAAAAERVAERGRAEAAADRAARRAEWAAVWMRAKMSAPPVPRPAPTPPPEQLPPAPLPPAEWRGTFGDTVRHRRRQAGFTLDDLASKTGISKPYLSLIETHRCRPPTPEKLSRIADALDMDADEMLARLYLDMVPRRHRPRMLALLTEGGHDGNDD